MLKKIILVVYLILIVGILIVPLLTDNHINQKIRVSSDMMVHESVINGSNEYLSYGGQIILKYLLKPFANSPTLDTAYLIFNYAVLIAIALFILYLYKKITSNKFYYFVILAFLFSCTGIIGLFKYGVIFNIINVYLILLGAIYLFVQWFNDNKDWKLVVATILVNVFSVFHYTGLYLTPIVITCTFGYVLWSLYKKDKKDIKKVLVVSSVIIVINIALLYLTSVLIGMFVSPDMEAQKLAGIFGGFTREISLSELYIKTSMFITYVSIPVLVLGLISVIFAGEKSPVTKGMLYVLGCCGAVLLFAYFVEACFDYNRLAIDASQMVTLCIILMVGCTLNKYKNWKLKALVSGLVLVGCIPNMITWVS